MMRRYPAYRESGVDWLGEVPEGWGVSSIKRVASIKYGIGEPPPYRDEGVPLIRATNVNAGRISAVGLVLIDPNDIPETRITWLAPGDIIVVRSGAYTGDSAIIEAEHCPAIAGFDMVLKPAGVMPQFLAFLLLSSEVKQSQIDLEKMRAAQPHLNAEEIGSCIIPLPPLSEQAAIAAFLDRETGKIDALVAEQRRLIDLLREKRQATISHAVTRGLNPAAPLKPSGIDWLGDVPEGWEVVRLAGLFREVAEPGSEDLPILSVSIHTGVSDDELSDDEMDRKVTRSDDRTKYRAVKPGDLTYNMMRAWQGGFGAVQVVGMVSPAYVVARPIDPGRFATEFVEYLLRTPNAVVEMKRHSRGVTDFRLRLYWDEFKSLFVALPPIEEQRTILAAIAEQISKFDTLITTAESAISLLLERRAALISAAVTGKIDVREPEAA